MSSYIVFCTRRQNKLITCSSRRYNKRKVTSYGKGKCEFSARVSWKTACSSLWMQNFHTHYSETNLLGRPFWDQWQSFYYSSLAGVEDVIRELGAGGQRGLLSGEESLPPPLARAGSQRAMAADPGKDSEVNQGQRQRHDAMHPQHRLLHISAHQNIHASALLFESPPSAPSPLSSQWIQPLWNTFERKCHFFCLFFSMCFLHSWWDVNLNLHDLASHVEGTEMMCVISHTTRLVSPKAHLQPTRHMLPPGLYWAQ